MTELTLLSGSWNDQDNPPVIDYIDVPFQSREGVQMPGNNKYATRAMFLETAKEEHEPQAPWCLSEHEIFAHGRWYPSAWMVYIHAIDEYDALRKICGNVKQWGYIKAMFAKVGRQHILDAWEAERLMLQKSKIREALMSQIEGGKSGATAAAKMVLQLDEEMKVGAGRPNRKAKPKDDEASFLAETAKRMGMA